MRDAVRRDASDDLNHGTHGRQQDSASHQWYVLFFAVLALASVAVLFGTMKEERFGTEPQPTAQEAFEKFMHGLKTDDWTEASKYCSEGIAQSMKQWISLPAFYDSFTELGKPVWTRYVSSVTPTQAQIGRFPLDDREWIVAVSTGEGYLIEEIMQLPKTQFPEDDF